MRRNSLRRMASEPNAHMSPPSTRGTVASVEKQEVVSVSTRGMDGTVPRVKDRAIPRKQKDATVPRVEPPPQERLLRKEHL